MRILLANGTAYPTIGGVENSLSAIGRELIRSGHEVKIFCLQILPEDPLLMENEGIEIIRVPYTPKRWPSTQLQETMQTVQMASPAILKKFNPEAIWCRSSAVGLGLRRGGYRGPLLQIFCTSAKMNCRGLYLQTHGLPISRRLMLLALWGFDYRASSMVEKELASQCCAVAFSENMRQQLLSSFPQSARSCHVIPPGVDTNIFSQKNGAQYFKQIEVEYGFSKDEPIILYVGRLSNSKNIPMLIKAVSYSKYGAKLLIVGHGAEKVRLQNYAKKINMCEQVVFAGPQKEKLAGFYARSRVCVLPTTTESFGQVYLESLATGTPVIGFSGNGRNILTATDEIILDGKTGRTVERPCPRRLAETIDSVLSLNGEEYEKMSRHAIRDVEERFSWEKFVEQAIKLTRLVKLNNDKGGLDG